MDSGAGHDPDPAPTVITPELLADLQAGLLDDATAAQVRRHARSDPDTARMLVGLDTVRRELARLGADDATAPDVPAAVTAQVGATLRTAAPRVAPRGGHALPRPALTRVQQTGMLVGVGAVVAAIVIGAVILTRGPAPVSSRPGPTASQITVSGISDPAFPLPDAEVRAALSTPPDLGPLTDAGRRAACLAGLGYSPTSEVLGGKPVELSGRPGILLLLPDPTAGRIDAVVVVPACTEADAGLIARTEVTRR